MIIKHHKGPNEVVLGFLLSLVIFFLVFDIKNVEIFIENYREKLLTYDLGISRLGNISSKKGTTGEKIVFFAQRTPFLIYNNIIGFDRPKIETLNIKIKFIDYKKIISDREIAIENQILRNPKEVNAVVEFHNKNYQAKIRLKGDLPDHWTSIYRMSLRVNLKGDSTIFGLSEFNIQKPRTRHYPYDPVFQDLVRSMGNLSVEHHVVKVRVNDNDWGFMDLESHVGKEFIERNRKKDSIVFRFSNEDGWHYEKTYNNPAPKYYRLSDPILFSKIYDEKKIFSEINRMRYSYVVNERINNNKELYDIDSYTKLLLLAKIWGEMHVLYENNIKHYFNPYTLKLEPISSDQYEPRNLNNVSDPFKLMGQCPGRHYTFVMDEPYQRIKKSEKYISNLPRNYEAVLTILDQVDNLFRKYYAYFPLENLPDTNLIPNNKSTSLSMGDSFFSINDSCQIDVSPKVISEWKENQYELSYHINAHHFDDGTIKIYNLIPDDINLLEIRTSDGVSTPINKVISGYKSNSYDYDSINTDLVGIYDDNIEIITEYNGSIKSLKLYKTLMKDLYNPLLDNKNLHYNFLEYKGKNTWEVPTGEWEFNLPLVIHGNLIINPGAKLVFDTDSYLIVNGQIIAKGLDKEKILFTSKYDTWMGLYVFGSNKISVLENVNIENTSSIKHGLLDLTGGVTFYKADVNIIDSIFSNSAAEDMLNIIESEFTINNSMMINAESDAIDSDFSNGFIKDLTIKNVNGDAIDTSGSYIEISNLKALHIRDKALSAGELSNITLNKCMLDSIGVGIAAKDGSKVVATECEIKNVGLASLMSYIKKNYYSPPSLSISSSKLFDSSSVIRQHGTALTIDGKAFPSSNLDVEALYESTFMKK